MNTIKKAFVVASAAVMCALPLVPAVSNNASFISVNPITADAATSKYKTPDVYHLNNGRSYYCKANDQSRKYEDVLWIQDAYMKIRGSQYYYVQKYAFPAITVDGYYGKNTEAAIKKFQSWYGIKADGYAGRETITALKFVLKNV
ncbi:peptidoglycan-binding domain-containing protein [Ruminococcus sp.]|jgi:hypothetical protein|uniref:peptidoglycan-binding domain-containing protein n=1 Tax=Ruminococcus sp. TaxID=41978 RepID=UPI0025E213C7|nr:peptidoglycan-binding domain-containing protein [Ruminococcus sp.]